MSKKTNIYETIAVILFIPLGFFWMFVLIFGSELIILKCNRLQLNQKVACEITHFGFRGKRITEIIPGQLQGAKERLIYRGRKGKKSRYQVFLLTEYDEIPIHDTFYGRSGSVASQKVDRINNFLNNPEQMSLKMVQYPHIMTISFVIMVVILLILLLVSILLGFRDNKSRIRRIKREISYPYHEDEKSDY